MFYSFARSNIRRYQVSSSVTARPRFRSVNIPSASSRDQSRRGSPFVLDLAEARRAREQARQSECVESLQGRRDVGLRCLSNDGLDINSALLIHTNAQLRTIVGAAVVKV